ncbi:hypothetical protein PPERSA_04959 [Pseudocohnilembus persalinus]|uniref:Uncharacterized protein n=1 Tax=Pseudocohnilembus persalinus TaxID=266149 RepID=A0A0V0QWA8_PSEPJ|nr:hypothetical protein PPERSA_04959 [Pseudocohnilembus persalinus]|eukprot:KRX06346.1 hypothetical protein PPERSA_04959 [Pseudocohnilembus persalinus]
MDIQIENIKQSFLEQQQFLKQQLENTKQELRQVKQERLKEIQQAKFETQNLVEEQAQEREIQMHQQYQDKYKAIYEQVTTSGSANIIQELEKKASLKQWFYVVKLISLQEKMKKQNQSEEFEVKNLLKKAGKENIFDIQKMKGKEIDPEILEHIEEQSKVIEKLQIENKEQTTKIEYLNMKHQRNSNNLELLNDQKEVYENQLRESNEELKSYKRIFEKLKDDIKYTETETGEQVQPKLIQKVKKVKKQFLQAIKKQENPDYLIEEINKQINDAQEQHKILFDSQHNKGVMTRIQDLTINLANLEEQAEQNFNEEEELVDSSNIKTPRPLLKTQQVQTDEKYSQANSGNLPRIISKRNQEGVLKRSMTVNANSPNNINSAKNDKNQRNQGQIIEENDDYYEDNNDNPDKNSLEYSNNYNHDNEFLNQSNKNFQNHTQDNLQQQNTVSFKKSNVNLRDPNSTQNQLKQQSQTQPFQGQNNKNFINNSDNQQINTPFNNGNYNQNNQQKGNATIQPYNLDRKVQLDNQISIRKNHQFSNLFGHINFDSENSIKKRTQSLHDGRKQNVLLQKYEQQLLNQNQNQNQNQNEYNNKNAFIPHFKTAHKNYQQDEDKNNNQNQNQNGNIDPEVLNQGEHFFDFKINQFVQVKNSPESAQIKFKKITNQNFENVIDPTKPQQLREFNTNQEEKQFLYQYLQDPRNILQYKQNQTKKLGINQKQAQFSTVPQSPQHKKQKQNTGQIKDFKAYMHGLELEKQKNLQQQKQSQKNDKQQTLREMIISGLSQKPQIMDYYNKKYQNLSAKDKFIKLQNSQFNHSILNNNVNLNQSFDDSKIINSSSHQQKLNLQNILGQQKSQNIKLQYQQQQQQQQQQQLNLNQKQTGDIQLQQQTVPLQKNNILNGIRAQTPNTQRRKLSNKM